MSQPGSEWVDGCQSCRCINGQKHCQSSCPPLRCSEVRNVPFVFSYLLSFIIIWYFNISYIPGFSVRNLLLHSHCLVSHVSAKKAVNSLASEMSPVREQAAVSAADAGNRLTRCPGNSSGQRLCPRWLWSDGLDVSEHQQLFRTLCAPSQGDPTSPLGSCRDLFKEKLKILPSVCTTFVLLFLSKSNYPICIFAAGASKCHSSL